MKQTFILLTGFLLVTNALHAQKKQPNFLAELSVGPSFPIGKFADKTADNLNKEKPSGLAKTGWGTNLSVGYYLNRSVGLLLSAGYSDHKQAPAGYTQSIYLSYSGRSSFEFNAKSWKEVNVRTGAFFVMPLTASHRLNLITKLTAGVCKTAIPALGYTAYKEDGTVLYEGTLNEVDLPWGFCYQIDAALKYKLGNHLHALLTVNSFNALPRKKFDGVTKQYNLSTVNCMAGIGIDF